MSECTPVSWSTSIRTGLARHPRLWPKRFFKEGVYRNQFETGLSSGSLSAFPGGARDTWESALFGGAYHTDGVTASERPKIRSPGAGSLS